jgi:hypothetical protein
MKRHAHLWNEARRQLMRSKKRRLISYLQQEVSHALEEQRDSSELFYPQLKGNPLSIGAVHRTGI